MQVELPAMTLQIDRREVWSSSQKIVSFRIIEVSDVWKGYYKNNILKQLENANKIRKCQIKTQIWKRLLIEPENLKEL
jgi:hypothetical protein